MEEESSSMIERLCMKEKKFKHDRTQRIIKKNNKNLSMIEQSSCMIQRLTVQDRGFEHDRRKFKHDMERKF